jgi:hypothetical protein
VKMLAFEELPFAVEAEISAELVAIGDDGSR